MTALRLSARAEQDLVDIAAHTRAQWGDVQAADYLAEIEQALLLLLEFPEAGRARDDIRRGCRSLAKAHILYYVCEGEVVDILGVLHERMDPSSGL